MLDLLLSVISFAISLILTLAMFVVIIRLLLYYFGATFVDPTTQWVLTLTNPVMVYFKGIPNFARIESCSLLVLYLLALIKFMLLHVLLGRIPGVEGIVLAPVVDCLRVSVDFYFYAVLIYLVLSWVRPQLIHNNILSMLCEPILRPVQHLIPRVGNFDLSPIVLLIGLQIISLLLHGLIVLVS